MRMLDNVIDINYYAVGKARNSNLKHRPVGLGIMGFQDCLHNCAFRTPRGSGRIRRPFDGSGGLLRLLGLDRTGRRARPLRSYKGSCGIAASCRTTRWRCWPNERGGYVEVDRRHARLGRAAQPHRAIRHAQFQLPGHRADRHDFQHRRRVASIEPTYQNLYVKSNLSGEFTVPTSTWCAT
jgi:ribonucleoside-diphosphate reductase alpha chain